MPKLLRISPVGLRGVVGNGLTVTHVLDFASAFGTFLSAAGPVLMGRDTRASGVMMGHAVKSALMACGRDVIDLGVVSTPVMQHSIQRLDAAGGISIGASHNSAEWNALKFIGSTRSVLSEKFLTKLYSAADTKNPAFKAWNRIGQRVETDEMIDVHIRHLRP